MYTPPIDSLCTKCPLWRDQIVPMVHDINRPILDVHFTPTAESLLCSVQNHPNPQVMLQTTRIYPHPRWLQITTPILHKLGYEMNHTMPRDSVNVFHRSQTPRHVRELQRTQVLVRLRIILTSDHQLKLYENMTQITARPAMMSKMILKTAWDLLMPIMVCAASFISNIL